MSTYRIFLETVKVVYLDIEAETPEQATAAVGETSEGKILYANDPPISIAYPGYAIEPFEVELIHTAEDGTRVHRRKA